MEDDYQRYTPRYRKHFDQVYKDRGLDYEQMDPAYRYGYNLRSRYRNRSWDDMELEAREEWERDQKGTWEKFRDAIIEGWESIF